MGHAARPIADIVGGKCVENGSLRRVEEKRANVWMKLRPIRGKVQIMYTGAVIYGCDGSLRHCSLGGIAKCDGGRRNIECVDATSDDCWFHNGIERAVAIGIVPEVFHAPACHLQLRRHPERKN